MHPKALFAPLRSRLAADGIAVSTVVAATIFTTQGITSELAAIYDYLAAQVAPDFDATTWQTQSDDGNFSATKSFQWTSAGDTATYRVMEGRLSLPNFQVGLAPYAAEGGALQFVDGEPQPVRTESARFVITLPDTPPRDGACYPIVEVAHGTTGSAYSFTYDGTAGRLAARGLAGISIDQPLHGPRWSGSSNSALLSLYTFNFFNPDAAVSTFRQSAIDTFALTRFVREALVVDAAYSPTGETVCFDPERVYFFGHSQGGLSGAIAATFERDISTWVLSGAGGGLSITMIERDDEYVDAQAVLRAVLRPADNEQFTEMHPVIGLVQLASEITDPINYSPYWFDRLLPTCAEGGACALRQNVMLTSGEFDAATPYRTAQALALAARMPIVEPVVVDAPGFDVSGPAAASAPVTANIGDATDGFLQWTGSDADHFVIFDRPEAINASMRLLETAAFENGPVIERDPDTDAR